MLGGGGLYGGFEQDPGYQFRQEQGEQAIGRMAAAQGGRLSGRTLKEMSRFNQGLASQEYQNFAARRAQEAGVAGQYDAQRQQMLQNQAAREMQAGMAVGGLQAGTAQQMAQARIGLGQYGAGLQANQGQQLAGMSMTSAQQQAAANMAGAQGLMGARMQGSQALANMYQNMGQSLSNQSWQQNQALANMIYQSRAAQAQAHMNVAGMQGSLTQSMLPQYQGTVPYAGQMAGALGQAGMNIAQNMAMANAYGGSGGNPQPIDATGTGPLPPPTGGPETFTM